MPELPEVEHCAGRLRAWCVGHRIEAVEARAGTPLREIEPETLAAGLVGRRVEGVSRLGKQLFISLDDAQVLLCHLGMTGKWVRDVSGGTATAGEAWRPGERVRWRLDDGSIVRFFDARRFGRIRLLAAAAAAAHPEVAKLGPDALAVCARRGGLRAVLRGRRPVKVALMDQSQLAGVGNIYASEALFASKIHPSTPIDALSPVALGRLQRALAAVLQASIEREQGEEIAYLHEGTAENPFQVYGRAGEPCPVCASAIARETHAGRSTFFCPRCQRDPGR